VALAFKIDLEAQARSGHSHNLKVARFPKANRPPVSGRSAQSVATTATVSVLPKKPRLPLWIKVLVGVQQGSTAVTGGLVAATLVLYSWTVYVDRSIARTGRELEALQTTAQQLTTANETLKHNMAEQATAPQASFEPYQPENAIFLEPAPGRKQPAPAAPSSQRSMPAVDAPTRMPYPLGY
jgi:hypothetical protein